MNSPQKSDRQFNLSIQGMTCASCVSHVERALRSVPGVGQATVNLATERARIDGGAETHAAALIEAVAHAGYQAQLADSATSGMATGQDGVSRQPGRPGGQGVRSTEEVSVRENDTGFDTSHTAHCSPSAESRREAYTLIASAVLSMPLVLPMLAMPFGLHVEVPSGLALLLATIVQFWLGARFYRSAYRGLITGTANMDLLIALGTSAAYGLSLYQMTWAGSGSANDHPLYFESSAVVITLVRLGKYLEARARRNAAQDLRGLQQLRPDRAQVLREGGEKEVAVEALQPGDHVVVRPGERIAADGLILEGRSQVDAAMVTGESLPVPCGPGDRVIGGTINLEGRLTFEVTARGSDTLLAQIIRQVEDAQAEKAPIQKLVDRVSGIFVPVVLVLALVTALAWGFFSGQWSVGILNAVAVLVIACPCALGLATPISVLVGTGVAARAGILIRNAEVLETAHHIRRVAFDKTGTLTEGKLTVAMLRPLGISSPQLLEWAAAVQAGSLHPLAQATLRAADEHGVVVPPSTQARVWPGQGVSAEVKQGGVTLELRLGSAAWLDEWGIDRKALADTADALAATGQTVSWLAQGAPEKRLLGLLSFTDKIKPHAREAVDQLRAMGIECVLLTGDNEGSAQNVGRSVGIAAIYAQLLPAQKARQIQTLKDQGLPVAMVGDGINDAPALTTADLGMAMASGTDVAMQTAGITLMSGDPRRVPAALAIARRTYAKIRQNLFWAMLYNVVGIPLAGLGYLSPVVAGTAMALSSVSVVANSLLLRRWRVTVLATGPSHRGGAPLNDRK